MAIDPDTWALAATNGAAVAVLWKSYAQQVRETKLELRQCRQSYAWLVRHLVDQGTVEAEDVDDYEQITGDANNSEPS